MQKHQEEEKKVKENHFFLTQARLHIILFHLLHWTWVRFGHIPPSLNTILAPSDIPLSARVGIILMGLINLEGLWDGLARGQLGSEGGGKKVISFFKIILWPTPLKFALWPPLLPGAHYPTAKEVHFHQKLNQNGFHRQLATHFTNKCLFWIFHAL